MGKEKLKLSFVNGGKPFATPHMTVKRQEELLEDIIDIEKKYKKNSDKYNREINKYMVMRVLKNIDDSITIDDINNMHPDDYVLLFDKIWNSGRELKREEDKNFR